MPCLFFEPTSPADKPLHLRTRLPLIEEYDGRCHALPEPSDANKEMRWPCCNQGYALGRCSHFPASGFGGAFRYSVSSQGADSLEVIWIEERDYAPFRHGALHFAISQASFIETGPDALLTAQALAFCRSYLKRHSERVEAVPLELEDVQSIT
jgi:hypothetical protein